MYGLTRKGVAVKKVIIFDLDGTLVDSMPVGVGIVLGYLQEKNIPYPSDIVTILTPLGYKGSAKYIAEHFTEEILEETIYEYFKQQTLHAYGETIPLKPHVKETLEELHRRGHRMSVLTASPSQLTEICLKRLGVYDLFDFVWSMDDFGMTKANPEIYKEAGKRMGVGVTDCVMADDNLNVLKTAKQAGMYAFGVYDDSSKEVEEEMKAVADRYVYDLSELL